MCGEVKSVYVTGWKSGFTCRKCQCTDGDLSTDPKSGCNPRQNDNVTIFDGWVSDVDLRAPWLLTQASPSFDPDLANGSNDIRSVGAGSRQWVTDDNSPSLEPLAVHDRDTPMHPWRYFTDAVGRPSEGTTCTLPLCEDSLELAPVPCCVLAKPVRPPDVRTAAGCHGTGSPEFVYPSNESIDGGRCTVKSSGSRFTHRKSLSRRQIQTSAIGGSGSGTIVRPVA